METSLTEAPGQERNLTVKQLVADKNLILAAVQETMEIGMDYGVIPGCQKPSLWKPGAEKLAMMFKLAGEPIEAKDIGSEDEVRYRVVTRFSHGPTGVIVAFGVGEASSNEEKYKWRKATCPEEFEETPEDRRRRKWVPVWDKGKKVWDKEKGRYEMEQIEQVRTNPADLANTILKMADKRSYISGILKATAASSTFTQDLEDLATETAEAVAQAEHGEPEAPIATPGSTSKELSPQEITERSAQVVKVLDALGVTTQMIGEFCQNNPQFDTEEKVLLKLEDTAANLATKKVTLENAFAVPKAAPESRPTPTAGARRGQIPASWKAMTSRKSGTCADCKKAIKEGDTIYWDIAGKRAHHKVCPS